MSKHTPGNWTLGISGSGYGPPCFGIFLDNSSKTICKFSREHKGPSLADGRLMSAAPELLEACEIALKYASNRRIKSLIEILSAAVKKARSEA